MGAGATQDAGLPNWEDLVRTFLQNGFREAMLSGDIRGEKSSHDLTETVLKSGDLMAAASMGRYLYGEDRRDEAIKTALCRHRSCEDARSINGLSARVVPQDYRYMTQLPRWDSSFQALFTYGPGRLRSEADATSAGAGC